MEIKTGGTITKDTKITQQATTFADGENGYFRQEYDLYFEGEYAGIAMSIEGEGRVKEHDTRVFITEQGVFDTLKEAAVSIGYTWHE